MSDSPLTEIDIPGSDAQRAEAATAAAEATRTEDQTPVPETTEPAAGLIPQPVDSDETTLELALEAAPKVVGAPTAPLEASEEMSLGPSVRTDSVAVEPVPAPGTASEEGVTPEVEAEQALTSVPVEEATPEESGAPESESAVVSLAEAAGSSTVWAGAPPVAALPAADTPVASAPTMVTQPATVSEATTRLQPASAPEQEAGGVGAPAPGFLSASDTEVICDTDIMSSGALEPEPEPEPAVVERPRSDKLWFYDGNIVIQTPIKQYRVHRSVLAMHSTFFRDMFELPMSSTHGNQANPMLDGCPVVQVPDDAEDWDAVLSIIYHTWESADKSNDNIIPVDIMLAMLRLGHKYDFERVRNDALRQLKAIFPNDIKACDAQFDDKSLLPVGKFSVLHVLHSLKMIATAVDLGIETVLPSAYAMVLRHVFGMKIILEGCDPEDERPVLHPETRNIIIRGDRAIMNHSHSFLFEWLRREEVPSGDKCQFPENCSDELINLHSMYPDDFPGVDSTSHTVLRHLSAEAREQMAGLCIPCFNAAVAAYDKGRAQMFEYLPLYFMMPPWNELQDFDTR